MAAMHTVLLVARLLRLIYHSQLAKLCVPGFCLQIHSLEPHISSMSRNAFLLRVNHQLTRGKRIIISFVVAER